MARQTECIPVLKALADETRWRIVRELLKKSLTVSELTQRLRVNQYNVSKHLRILREAGIVTAEKQGKNLHCAVDPEMKQKIARKMKKDYNASAYQITPHPFLVTRDGIALGSR